MSRNTKIVLGVIVGLFALCLCGAVAGTAAFLIPITRTVVNSPSGQMVDYTLPDGYREAFRLNLAGLSMVLNNSESEHGHIYLMHVPANVQIDRQALENRMRDAADQNRTYDHDRLRMRRTGERTVTILGQQVQMSLGEGTNSEGQPYRDMVGMFQAEQGSVMLMISAPVDEWDETAITDFLASIG